MFDHNWSCLFVIIGYDMAAVPGALLFLLLLLSLNQFFTIENATNRRLKISAYTPEHQERFSTVYYGPKRRFL